MLRLESTIMGRIARTAWSLLILGVVAFLVSCVDQGREALAQGLDLEGNAVDVLGDGNVTVLVFVRSDCPIANRYAPELSRLNTAFASRGVDLRLVYPDANASAGTVRAHMADFGLSLTPVLDPQHRLVRELGMTISPEAAVLDRNGRLVYRGRIDDRSPAVGINREPRERDLENAILAVLEGHVDRLTTSPAVGCYLSDLP